MRIRIYIFVLFCLAGTVLRAANNDSLLQVMRSGGPDSARAKAYSALAGILMDTLPDSSRVLFASALQLARDSKNEQVLQLILFQYGYFFFDKGIYPKALDLYLERLRILERIGDKKTIAKACMGLGNVYILMGSYQKGLEYQEKALTVYRETGDTIFIGNSLNNIGVSYFNQKDYRTALDYFNQARELRERIGDKRGLSTSYGNIGNIYAAQHESEKALEWMQKAVKLHEELKNQSGLSFTLCNMGSRDRLAG
jgi:tetratricopeptide (TPR) repeat protein